MPTRRSDRNIARCACVPSSVYRAAALGSLFVALAGLLSGQTPAPTTSRDCHDPLTDTRKFNTADSVKVRTPHSGLDLVPVTDGATRERGLMCVVRVPHDRGMLFVFEPPDREQNFWMKNTLVGLDMVFVKHDGLVTDVAAGVPATTAETPDSSIARRAGFGRFVIELGAGDAARHGIVPGTKLTLPALSSHP